MHCDIFCGINVSTCSVHTVVHCCVEALSYDEPHIFMVRTLEVRDNEVCGCVTNLLPRLL